jgi:hypothetical protein
MTHMIRKCLLVLGLAAAVWAWNGDIWPTTQGNVIATAEAVVGAPATPVSYAGVARRSTVGAGAPGAGVTPGAGAGAAGAGVTHGAGAGAPGAGAAPANRGGPVNRVGAR